MGVHENVMMLMIMMMMMMVTDYNYDDGLEPNK